MREATSKIGLSMVTWQDGAATEWGKRVVECHWVVSFMADTIFGNDNLPHLASGILHSPGLSPVSAAALPPPVSRIPLLHSSNFRSPGLCPWTSSIFYFLLFLGDLKAFHGFPCHLYSFCCYYSWRLKKFFFYWSIVDLQCCASFSNPTPGHITGDNHNPKRYMRTCTPMFIAALFTIARAWKQRGWPLTDKWIKKVWYIYTMEYHSAIKRKEVILFTCNNMDGPRDCHTKWSLSSIF